MSSNLPPGITDWMIPGNRPEDQEMEITLVLSVGEMEDFRCELENQMNLIPEKRSPVWYALENLVKQFNDQNVFEKTQPIISNKGGERCQKEITKKM